MLFAENQQQTGGRIHYVLFNPWAVRSNEALNSFDSPLMKLLARAIYAIVGVSVEEASLFYIFHTTLWFSYRKLVFNFSFIVCFL